MSNNQYFELPANCYTKEYLAQSGIKCEYNYLDTYHKKGPSKSFYVSLFIVLICVVVYILDLRLQFLHQASVNTLITFAIVFFINLCVSLFSYLLMLKLRHDIRKDPAPLMVEPVAIMILLTEKQLAKIKNPRRIPWAFVYKESGSKKPGFYMSAEYRGLPDKYNPTVSLLYKSRITSSTRLSKYYSIDNDYNYNTDKRKHRIFNGSIASS